MPRHFVKYIQRHMSSAVAGACDDFVQSILNAEVGGAFTFLSGQLIQEEDGIWYFCVFEQEKRVVPQKAA